MATVTYRCSADPEGCGDRSAPGYCDRHAGAVLERVRETVAPPGPAPASGAADRPAFQRPQLALELLGRSVPVPPDGLVLGREERPLSELAGMAELTQVSRRHARLSWLADRLYVEDCRSINGTYVDGEKVVTPQRVDPGQCLRLALDVEVRVVAVDTDEFGLPR
jgi:hypothetical protein